MRIEDSNKDNYKQIQSNLITNVHILTNVLTMTECNLCSRKTCRCPVLVRD